MHPRIAIPDNPLARFRSIYEALETDRRWWRDSGRLRYAAVATICTDGIPSSIASGIRNTEKGLKDASPWHMDVGSHVRFVVSAILYQNGDSAKSFIKELIRVRKMFRAEKLHRALAMELMAVLVLRIQVDGGPISRQTVRRFRHIYDEMKKHHRWLTGSDDFPACAILTGQDGTPHEIGNKTEAIYSELRSLKFQQGDALQTAANLLFLAEGTPQQVTQRTAALKAEFREHKVRISQPHYDELAMLAFLKQPAEKVVAQVISNRAELKKIRPRMDAGTTFNLAVGTAFVGLSGKDLDAVSLSRTKALIDMQTVLAAQQAAVAGAAAASAAAT